MKTLITLWLDVGPGGMYDDGKPIVTVHTSKPAYTIGEDMTRTVLQCLVEAKSPEEPQAEIVTQGEER